MKRLIQCIGSVFLLALIIATVNPSASAAYTFSSQGYNDVLYWAGQKKPSDMTTNEFAAVILAVTWPEASQYPPSPMTMGRADVSTKLYSFANNSYKRAFFHAGVGAWQLDGGGLGSNLLTAAMISTYSASQTAATKMASLWSQASGTKQQKLTWASFMGLCVNGNCSNSQ